MTSQTVRTLPLPPVSMSRLSLPDALRGFGLFGLLMINLLGIIPGHAVAGLLVLMAASLWTGHAAVLRESVAHHRFWRCLLCAGFAVNLIATVGASVAPALHDVALLAQGAFFAAAFVLLFQRAAWRRWLLKLVPAGRMALTNGLAQALLTLCILHDSGLHLDPVSLVVFGIAIFALQATTSCWWLARYNAGPAEWLCHGLVSGKPQPMRRHAQPDMLVTVTPSHVD